MIWDVFVSYASEDRWFARNLTHELESFGLRVWFDETALEAGDSLRRSIDAGLKNSRYGVVVLSTDFFRKEWPQRELDALTVREDGKLKVIIPIWHNVTVDDIRDYSPSLADKYSIYSGGSIDVVAAKIFRAIQKDQLSATGWRPAFTRLSEGTELTIIPIRLVDSGFAACIGRYPVSNASYRRFVQSTSHACPTGKEYRDGAWHGPFLPWEESDFSDPEKPVVCVNFFDAAQYCQWLTKDEVRVFLPPAALWEIAAAGGSAAFLQPRAVDVNGIHHRSTSPAPIDRSGGRDNSIGVSDMIGNVWEWVSGSHLEPDRFPDLAGPRIQEPELRGGGFLDNLERVQLFLQSVMLENGIQTCHSDLGFRIGAIVPIDTLPKAVVSMLESLPHPSVTLCEAVRLASRYFLDYASRYRFDPETGLPL